ncbi:hypothetical protein M3P05_06755 [Sansalvadorimonas sp. 2012CJ34-2]|uniref:MAM domain-containing protein n=1 Tax=Parendozoicomonas callyspongiae TaxID=2942213 RepID=A0ABT0PE54_9GAMM|nr:hypothetical protein [Sansalvadorimonas sp. 2012CJ34-2]MCL6269640.1 hypothetical protein [Sansalvadorimonas sp. 2012CJ34-2]
MIDCALEFEGDMCGWEGGKTSVFVTNSFATEGFKPGLKPRQWNVVIGKKVSIESEVNLQIQNLENEDTIKWIDSSGVVSSVVADSKSYEGTHFLSSDFLRVEVGERLRERPIRELS